MQTEKFRELQLCKWNWGQWVISFNTHCENTPETELNFFELLEVPLLYNLTGLSESISRRFLYYPWLSDIIRNQSTHILLLVSNGNLIHCNCILLKSIIMDHKNQNRDYYMVRQYLFYIYFSGSSYSLLSSLHNSCKIFRKNVSLFSIW